MPIYDRFYLIPNPSAPGSGVLGNTVLFTGGPRLPVEIHVPNGLANYLTQHAQPVPAPVIGEALVDTGASVSCVDERAIQSLGVNPVGIANVGTPSTAQTPQLVYPVRFVFTGSNLPPIEIAHALGSILQPQRLFALIGRDVLRNFQFIYHGPGGYITLSF